MSKILWVDDEIDHLKPHILFLESKSYEVSTCTNGLDALKVIKNTQFDIVLLNPPWLTISSFPQARYKKQLEKLWTSGDAPWKIW